MNPYYVVKNWLTQTKHVMVGDTRVATTMATLTTAGKPSTAGAPTFFYYHPDHLQSTAFVTNQTGKLLQHDEYFASGEVWFQEALNADSRNTQPYLFNAKELDETGFYYYGARHFDPRTSMWINPDPILASYMQGEMNGGVFAPQNLGLYSYAWNNPIVLQDPDGAAVGESRFVRIGKGLLGAGYGALKSVVPAGFLARQPGGALANDSDFLGGQAAGEATVGSAEVVVGGAIAGVGVVAEGPSLGTSTAVVVAGVAVGAEGVADIRAAGNTLAMASKAADAEGKAQKGPGTVADEHGVKVEVYSNDHGPPHAHVKSGERNTRIGQNGKPLRGEGELTKIERKVTTRTRKTSAPVLGRP